MLMQTKDLMLAYLQDNGFRPEEQEYGLVFRYEGANFLYFNNEDDNAFFQLTMPGIYEINDGNRQAVYAAMNAAYTMAKVVKLVDINGAVWVTFEILVDSTPELGDIVPRALAMLQNGRNEFAKALMQGQN